MQFVEFPKIYRANRDVIVTEKIDGTNACVIVGDDGFTVGAQSRSRIITPEDDNFGFAAWVRLHEEELRMLGPGHHFGEWWGRGIQRGYDRATREFSLFNVTRWTYSARPACCGVVPIVARGVGFGCVAEGLEWLRKHGSVVSPGFMRPEGVVAFHAQGNILLKATLERDEEPKGKTV